jgi:hypothetical protein
MYVHWRWHFLECGKDSVIENVPIEDLKFCIHSTLVLQHVAQSRMMC